MEAEVMSSPAIHGPGGKENRRFLSDLCDQIYTEQDEQEGLTKNECLIRYYTSLGFSDFKTYRQWKAEGKQVKKGEKAFLLWARPVDRLKKEEAEAQGKPAPDENEGPDFFPLCYVFAASQVQ